MFSIPIEEVTFDAVNSFCQARPREGLVLDYKLDFPRRLEKTIAAFANTYGGLVLIGVDETQTGEPVLPISGVALQPGLRERVVAISLDAIYPPVYPEVKVVEFQSPGAATPDRAVIVIRVHESEASAHAVDGGKSVYLRVDNISDHFLKQATTTEIEWLINKRKKSLDFKDRLLAGARNRASNYVQTYRSAHQLSTQEPRGKYIMWTVPTFPRNELATRERLLELSRTWSIQVAGYNFPTGSAVPIVDGVRHPQSPALNYWYTEVNRFGLVYTEIGYTGGEEFKNVIVCSLVASLLVASLRFSINLYNTLGYFGLVDFQFDISPTLNLYPYLMGHIAGPQMSDHRTLENTISLGFTASTKETEESLVQRAQQCYREFMWAFGLNVDASRAASHFASFSVP